MQLGADIIVLQNERAVTQGERLRLCGVRRPHIARIGERLRRDRTNEQTEHQKHGQDLFHGEFSSFCSCFCLPRSCSRIQRTVSTTARVNAATPTAT